MIVLILIFILVAFNCFRSSLRGIKLSLLDALSMFLSSVFGFILSPFLVGNIMNSPLYINVRGLLSKLINYNSVIYNVNISDQVNYIENLNLPKSMYLIISKNNTEANYELLNAVDIKSYCVASIMFVVSKFLAFSFFAILIFVILYYIRLIFMPKIKIKDYGIYDKIVGGFIGILKGIYLSIILMISLLMYYSTIGFAQYQMLPENNFVVYFFNNYHFILDIFL